MNTYNIYIFICLHIHAALTKTKGSVFLGLFILKYIVM